MKLTLTDDDGTVLDTFDKLEGFDLSKSIARSMLSAEILESIERHAALAKGA
jgi:hypothetical protein